MNKDSWISFSSFYFKLMKNNNPHFLIRTIETQNIKGKTMGINQPTMAGVQTEPVIEQSLEPNALPFLCFLFLSNLVCHLELTFSSAPYTCLFYQQKHMCSFILYFAYSVSFKAFQACDPWASLTINGFLL